ncbi:FAD-dependent oxidoreductase [Tsukamurella sp. 8F]|uniref:FAD-dependent oxidoreductase n=1 Tax=unclassified Tsukamurella TaxID=2633480 RepID=UPI0023BA1D4D|nr:MULTISPECIES: FAD-dependent oxidoreductase [unclassified Tsukamurella]MDF0530712.1 FAD-dependent oxidoreductase [Tsukamurella sp. 8J]MDF0587913.1 FAD-dependent oxidoreductase [Tsukamurella sp. 8F]
MQDVRPVQAGVVEEWDLEADVVVAGYGIAGVCAAIEAARAGAEVLVLERTGGWGGAAALSGGWIYLGGGTALQRALGFDDTPEAMARFMSAALGPAADDARIGDYCAGSAGHYDWLVDCGVEFKPEFWSQPGWEVPHDEGLGYSGGENSAPFRADIPPAPRGHVPRMQGKRTGVRGAGYMLMRPLAETAESLGVRAEFDVRVSALVTGDGRIAGLRARRYGRDLTVRARRGVVLATGGFTYNADMVAAHAPRLAGRPAAAIEEHDGVSILMAQAVGAAVAHMDATEVAFFGDPQLLARGIVVNGRGQRFIAEDTYPGRIGQAVLLDQGNEAFLVIDEAGHDEGVATATSTPFFRQPPTWAAGSIAELEADMGLPAGALQGTVDMYNAYAECGEDPLLGKKREWLRPLRSPFAAFDMRGFTAGFTLGGLRCDLDGRVQHVAGGPIDGLYAAGRCTWGLASGGYASGTSLGDGSFYGRRAGAAAARRTSGDAEVPHA